MKKNILKGVIGLVVAGTLASCSSDYLQVDPKTSIDSSTVTSSVSGAQKALYGACASMYGQWSSFQGYYSFNGESQFMFMYGEVPGQDVFSWIWAGRTSTWALNWDSMANDNAWIPLLGWIYNYTLISEVNNILGGIDTAEGDESLRDFVKAQALTIRAHAYTRLLQLYAPRWQDSNNGEKLCLVLRLDLSTGDSPLVSMNTILDRIYTDLDDAIALYQSCGQKRAYKWEPNIDVAKGTYARAALIKNDYPKAENMAKEARAAYPIMTADDYKSGFALSNSEYLWQNDPSAEGVFYFAWGSWYTCNGPYPNIWGHGPGAINYDLYKMIPTGSGNNAYKDLYFTPDKRLLTGLSAKNFWDPAFIDETNMNLNGKVKQMMSTIASYNARLKPAVGAAWPNANTPTKETSAGTTIVVPFGAQYKFWSVDEYGTTAFPFMRASELLLTEAEAAYHNNHPEVAIKNLNELAAKRVDGYTCSKSGEDLLNEIRTWRRIELWGEGHSWFDLKRWNLPMERRPWIKDDVNSNNIPKVYAVKFNPDFNNGWRYVIPRQETQYNHAIDRSAISN